MSSELYLQQFLECPIPAFIWRREGHDFAYMEGNHAAEELGGRSSPAYAGRLASDIYGTRPEIVAAMEKAWATGAPVSLDIEYRLTASDRDVLLRLMIAAVPPDHLIIYTQDSTAELEARNRMRESERSAKQVIEGALDGVVVLTPDGRIEHANPATRAMFGYEEAPLANLPVSMFIPEDDLRRDPIQMERMDSPGGMVRERRLLRRDGTIMHAELSARTIADGRRVVFIRDLTQKREADAALRHSEEQYRRMVELSPEAILVHSDGRIVYANGAALRLFGATHREDVIGRSVLHFVHPDYHSMVTGRIREVTEDHADVPVVVEKFVRLDGTAIDVEVAGLSLEYEGRPAVQVIARDISERRLREEELRQSEERYRGLVEGASDAIFRLGLDGRIVSLNPATTRITGWSEQDLTGTHFERVLHRDDLAPAREAFIAAAQGRSMSGVYRIINSEGSVVVMDITTAPEMRDGVVTGVFGMGRDITEARKAARLVEERERLLATVLDTLPVGVIITDAEGHVVRSNPAADQIWASHIIETAIAAPRPYRGWWSDTGLPIEPLGWASSLNELVDIEDLQGVRKTILNSAVPLRDESGSVSGALVLNQDVTEQREVARQREALAERLRQVISSTSDAICTIDTDGKVTLANPAAVAMTGYDEHELLGANFSRLLHDEVSGDDPFHQVICSGTTLPLFADRFRRRGGVVVDVEVSCSPIVADGRTAGAVIAFRDVSQRNFLERELERATRLSSIGQLAATIAHEFNNVLMGIAPFADVLIRKSDSDPSLRRMAGHVGRALQRGKQITGSILKFAQAAEPDAQPHRVRDLLHASLEELRGIAGSGVTIRLGPIEDGLAVCVDRTQVQQVLSNLVANARDAMSERGVIDIEAVASSEGTSGLMPGDYVRISVRDYGSGIDASLRERIFEPLFTTKKARGTGLGLAVVQQIVARHNGRMAVESEVGKGTVFHMYFARCEPPPGAPQPAATQNESRIRRVLIIEDDENVSAGLLSVLELEGIEARIVALGSQAEAEVERFAPEAVVLDRGLPDMDGIEVYRRLSSRWPGLPIVFSTGHGSRADLDETLDRGNVGYLLKPYDIDTLLEMLHQVTRGRG